MLRTLNILTALLLGSMPGWAQPDDWYTKPVFEPAAAEMKSADVRSMLPAACAGKVFSRPGKNGLLEQGCSMCPVGSDFFSDGDALGGVSVSAVTFGHFVSAMSEDVLLAVTGCESHASYYGGSFLLTRTAGRWRSLGYHNRLITEQCHKVPVEGGREILVCSHYFGGQGFIQRFLYTLDFGVPKKPIVYSLLTVENGLRACGQAGEKGNPPVPQSDIASVTFADVNISGSTGLSILAHTGEFQRTEAQYQACVAWSMGKGWKNPPPVRTPAYRINYLLKGSRFVLKPESVPAMKHFPHSDVY